MKRHLFTAKSLWIKVQCIVLKVRRFAVINIHNIVDRQLSLCKL